MAFTVERDWMAHGLRCVAIAVHEAGHRCGYVGVPARHPLHGVGYSEPCNRLREAWEKAKGGTIGKRGIISLMCASDDEAPRPDCVFDVHGSLTYRGGTAYPVAHDNLWWFGFDCGHCDDARDFSIMPDAKTKAIYAGMDHGGEVRTLDYVAGECERLAEQLAAIKED